jgi:hypothetical protein
LSCEASPNCSARGSHGAPALKRSAPEILVPTYDSHVVAKSQSAGEMNGVVSPQGEIFGKVARLPRECHVHPNLKQLVVQLLELLPGPNVIQPAQSAAALCRRERRPTLGITKDARGRLDL